MTGERRRLQRVAAYALCTNDGRLLIARIAPGATAASDGMWTLPGGGIDFGEDPRDAAIRELLEETGLVGEVLDLAGVDSVAGELVDPYDAMPTDWHGIRILYRVRIVGGELRDEPEGTTDTCRWVSAPELRSLPTVDLVDVGGKLIGFG